VIPEVNELESLDVYRDGGSLSVTYKDGADNQHELVFSIDNRASDGAGSKRIYRNASIISYTKSEYVSPVTGVASPKHDRNESVITWSEAANLIKILEPHLKGSIPNIYGYLEVWWW